MFPAFSGPEKPSMARYGTNKVPFNENMRTNPQDPYGIGKVAGEDFLKNLCNIHNIEWVIAVPHNIIPVRLTPMDKMVVAKL